MSIVLNKLEQTNENENENLLPTYPTPPLHPEHKSSHRLQPHQACTASPSWGHTWSIGWSWDHSTPPCQYSLWKHASPLCAKSRNWSGLVSCKPTGIPDICNFSKWNFSAKRLEVNQRSIRNFVGCNAPNGNQQSFQLETHMSIIQLTYNIDLALQSAGSWSRACNLHWGYLCPCTSFWVVRLGKVCAVPILKNSST